MKESGITAETTVNEAIRRVPAALAIFAGCGIDSCCGGALPIGEAARRHGVDGDTLLERIRTVEALRVDGQVGNARHR